MQDLRQSTASQIISLGQFLDSTDGDAEENGLTIANTDIKLRKNGATTLVNKNSGGATNISNGVYHTTLNATDSNTLGRLEIYVHVAGALAVKATFRVLTATAFDAIYTGTFNNLGGVAQSADNDTKLTTLLARIIGTLESGSHNPASVAQLGALTDWLNGGRLDLILDIIAADTTTDIPALIAALNDFNPASDDVAVVTALTTNNDKTGYSLTITPPTAVENRQEMDTNSVDLNSLISGQSTINSNVLLIDTAAMRGTDGANTTTPPTASTIATAVWVNSTRELTAFGFNIDVNIASINNVAIIGDGDATPFDVA